MPIQFTAHITGLDSIVAIIAGTIRHILTPSHPVPLPQHTLCNYLLENHPSPSLSGQSRLWLSLIIQSVGDQLLGEVVRPHSCWISWLQWLTRKYGARCAPSGRWKTWRQNRVMWGGFGKE